MSNRRDRYVRGGEDRERGGYSTGGYPPESEATSTLSEESAPDCIGKLLGVRLFKPRPPWASSTPRKDRLYSLCFDHVWIPGKDVRAECRSFGGRKAAEHFSPYEECMCGLYAFYSYWLAWCENVGYGVSKIFAVVSAWGEIEEHTDGFRSEHMRIEALVGPSPSTIRRKKAHQVIERFARIYEVPIIKSPWHVHGWMDGFAGGVRLKQQK
jgi:hypothetical protein